MGSDHHVEWGLTLSDGTASSYVGYFDDDLAKFLHAVTEESITVFSWMKLKD